MTATNDSRASSGIPGLDDVLAGGLPQGHLYVVEGEPGTGKTTVGMQYLLAGAARGEQGLYVALSETTQELQQAAASHGWSFDGIDLYQMSNEAGPDAAADYTVFHPAEVELGETLRGVFEHVERLRPRHIVFDSLSEMRLLARDSLRYRRQILQLKQQLADRNITVILLDDKTAGSNDLQLHSIAHGVVSLEQLAPTYGAERRRLRVLKLRGSGFRGGYHDFVIRRGGVVVFPRLVAAEHEESFERETFASGIPELDAMFGGGLSRGTVALLVGPAGAGKSLISLQMLITAAERGHRSAFFAFDEGLATLRDSADGLGMNLLDHVRDGLITMRQIDSAELTPGQFVHIIRDQVEREHVRIVVLDSLNGYLNAMPEEQFLGAHLHELSSYLRQQGVLTMLTMAQHGIIGAMTSVADVSYLADTIVLFRFYEYRGAIRRAISMPKKRASAHEHTIRDLTIGPSGIRVGPPLTGFQGVLTGTPTYLGEGASDGDRGR